MGGERGVSPEVHDHLHSFERVKLQVVKTAPDRLHLNSQLLESVSRLVIILDEADQCGVVSTRTGIENRWSTGRRAVCRVVEVLMVVWRGVQLSSVGCFFKPAIELIQIACQLLILHSAGGRSLIVGYLFQTFPH